MNAPKTSIRQLSQQINLFVGITHTMLHKNLHLYPYRITAVKKLKQIMQEGSIFAIGLSTM
jgi:hypothetical protein